MKYTHVVFRRNKNILFLNEHDACGYPIRRVVVNLTGYDYVKLRKRVKVGFKGRVKPENLYYFDDNGKPVKLKLMGLPAKEKPDTAPKFIVLMREGTRIYYKELTKTEQTVKRKFEDETAPVFIMDLDGYSYRQIYKRATFYFDGNEHPSKIRFYVYSDVEPRSLTKMKY